VPAVFHRPMSLHDEPTERQDDKPQRPGALAPLQNVIALLLALPLSPLTSPRHPVGLAMARHSTASSAAVVLPSVATSAEYRDVSNAHC
jgi:hypothetical protein